MQNSYIANDVKKLYLTLKKLLTKKFLIKRESKTRWKITIKWLLGRVQQKAAYIFHARKGFPEKLPRRAIVTGFFGENFGISIATEMTARGLEKNGFEVIRHNARPILDAKPFVFHSVPGNKDDLWIIQLNPPGLEIFLSHIYPQKAPQYMRLGVWELEKLPESWRHAQSLVDAVLPPSRFVGASLSVLKKPVGVLPHPVSLAVTKVTPRMQKYPNRVYKFYCQFDGNSSLDRKNPFAVIDAFNQAFSDADCVELILKSHSLSDKQIATILEKIAGNTKITLYNSMLCNEELRKLQESTDCLISAHRSEGFGLAIAEAALWGRTY